MSDIKMSGVLGTPVVLRSGGIMPFVDNCRGFTLFVADQYHAEAAAHAINTHDTLVAQNLALKAALEKILRANKNDSYGGFLTFEEIEDGLKALEVGNE